MRIGVNALYLIPGGVGGTEVYLRSLLEAMPGGTDFVSFINRETSAAPLPGKNLALPVRAESRPRRILAEQLQLGALVKAQRIDVLLNPGFTAPWRAPCPQVTVFHDLQHKRHPEFFRPLDLPFWRMLLYQSAHTSRRLIAVSEATKADLRHFYKLPEERIDVIPHGVSAEFLDLERAPEDILLCVSTLHPHKNIERLVRVFTRLHREHPELRLVLAGMRGFANASVQSEIRASDAQHSIRTTGWIPRGELMSLYRRARAVVYPSTFEGFGMPVLEALAAGIPTACSDIPPLREIASGHAILFDPHSDEAMLEALRRLMRAAPPDRGHAARYTWRAAAEATLRTLEKAYRSRSSS